MGSLICKVSNFKSQPSLFTELTMSPWPHLLPSKLWPPIGHLYGGGGGGGVFLYLLVLLASCQLPPLPLSVDDSLPVVPKAVVLVELKEE